MGFGRYYQERSRCNITERRATTTQHSTGMRWLRSMTGTWFSSGYRMIPDVRERVPVANFRMRKPAHAGRARVIAGCRLFVGIKSCRHTRLPRGSQSRPCWRYLRVSELSFPMFTQPLRMYHQGRLAGLVKCSSYVTSHCFRLRR